MPDSQNKISVQNVHQLAEAAQINLSNDEADSFAEDLNNILDGVWSLAEYANIDVEPTVRPFALQNVMRTDEVKDVLTVEEALSNAPSAEDNMFKVSSILGGEQ